MKTGYTKAVAVAVSAVVFVGILASGGLAGSVIRGGANNDENGDLLEDDVHDRDLLEVDVQYDAIEVQYIIDEDERSPEDHGSAQVHAVQDYGTFGYDVASSSLKYDKFVEKTKIDTAGGLGACTGGDLFIQATIKADSKMADYGSLKLRDYKHTSTKFWDYDHHDWKKKKLYTYSQCLPAAACYEFKLYGKDKAFIDDDDDDDSSKLYNMNGYAVVWADVGKGMKMQMEEHGVFDTESVKIGCKCSKKTSGC